MPQYRVVDLRSNVIEPHDVLVADAATPEEAVEKALGLVPVRGGSTKDLVARVYWQIGSKPVNMVRLYRAAPGQRAAQFADAGEEVGEQR